jgi:hypothetical protein
MYAKNSLENEYSQYLKILSIYFNAPLTALGTIIAFM